MLIWNDLVNLFRALIFGYSQACGGNLGLGIMMVTFLMRAILYPLTLRLQRATIAHRELMQKLKPELDRIRERFRTQPNRLAQETRRLFEREGASSVPLKGCLGNLVQLPIMVALFEAVRRSVQAGGQFLWIGNLAKPDVLLTLIVSAIACLTAAAGSTEQNSVPAIVLPTLLTFVVLLRVSSGIGLYWGVSNLIGLSQSLVLRRERIAAQHSS